MKAAQTGSFGTATGRLLPMLMLAVYGYAAEPLSVTAVRYWSLADATRIAVETNGPFTFKSDRLHVPERAFYDMQNAKPKLIPKGIYTVNVGDSRVRQIRVAQTSPTVTRIVLDLMDGDFEITTSELTVPDRLMIEIKTNGAPPVPSPALSSTGLRKIPVRTAEAPIPQKPFDPPAIDSGRRMEPLRNSNVAAMKLPAPPSPAAAAPAPVLASPIKELEKSTVSESSAVGPSARSASRNSNGDRSLTRVLGLKLRRVVIDPGHGGNDHGTTGPNGLTEKDLVLDVSRRVAALIEEGLGSEVVFTRNNDSYIALEDRPALANAKKADLFLSIHANSSPIKSVTGVETYYLSITTSRAAMEVAARENAASTKSISDLKELLQKIALREKVDESREFAAKVQTSLTKLYPAPPKGTPAAAAHRDRGVKRAPFVVLIGAQMPAILTEIGFVTNAKEEQLLLKPEYRQKVAEAIYKGLEQYAETLSKFEVAQTSKRTGTE